MTTVSAKPLLLNVAEALPKDVGRGIARMDPEDMSRLGVQSGDILLVTGKRGTAVKVMPSYPDTRSQGVVQIDGLTRENAQANLGEQVQLHGAPIRGARTVVLAPVTPSSAFAASKDTRNLEQVLMGLPLTKGDKVRATFLGGRYQEFWVVDANPADVVLVGPSTRIKIKGEGLPPRQKNGVTYEDIGALRNEIQKVREMVELPLKYPELFERLGIEAPKGVLLHGPPGCGKTLIARAVANETDAAFFHVSGPEIVHKFYGESEAHLRAIFDEARAKAPAIIFLDEIDAIGSKREEVRGDQQVERRIVAQLLALMDGLKSRGQVIVIGATNIPQVLDPALRRPGRFDREVAVSVPDKRGRQEILEIHSRGMPLAPDVRLERLAEVTHGFVGADLEALCREAAMATLRKIMTRIHPESDYIPDELLSELKVTAEDFTEALREVEPSAIREVFTEIPDVRWEDVGGLDEVKQVLRETVEWPIRYADLFQQAKIGPPKGVMLTGPPGTGKTLLAKAVASQSGVNFISVKGPALLSMWIGESEKGVREVFRKARQASPCIIFFDEIDAFATTRSYGSDSSVTQRVISQLLTELDGIEELKGVMVLAATNRPDMVDPALLRTGRFDLKLELPAPDLRARRDIFAIHTRGKPLAPTVDLDWLAAATEGLVGSDIEAICRRASMLALREFIGREAPDAIPADAPAFQVLPRHFAQAIQEMGKPAA